MLDRWLGTRWIWLPGFLLGIAAAIMNVYRTAKKFIESRPVMTSDANALLHRLQTTAAVCCGAMAIVALVLAHGQPRPAVGVVGGGLLAGVSLVGIRSSVGGLVVGYGRHRASARGVGPAEGGGSVRFTRSSGVRF